MQRPKVMLHPQLADDLRTKIVGIENNVAGSISWERLAELFRQSGEMFPEEEIEAFVLSDDRIQFYVRRR